MDFKRLDGNIKKMSEIQTHLQTELDQLRSREQVILNQMSEDMLSGNFDETTNKLGELRIRKETIEQALELSRQRVAKAQEDRLTAERAEIAGQWVKIDQELRLRLARIREITGQSGLKGELDDIRRILTASEHAASIASQDAEIKQRRLFNFVTEAELTVDWFVRMLDSLENLP